MNGNDRAPAHKTLRNADKKGIEFAYLVDSIGERYDLGKFNVATGIVQRHEVIV